MKTLVLPARYTEDSIAIRGAAIERGWNVERFASWRAPAHLLERQVVLYGEALFCAAFAEQLGIAMVEPDPHLLAHLPRGFLLRAVTACSLGEARTWPSRAFIKPADEKCFPARIYESGAELPAPPGLSEDAPVLISEPVDWESEFRVFALDGEPLTLSPYLRRGELACNADGQWPITDAERETIAGYVRKLTKEASIEIPVVIDVGWIAERGMAVIEFNAAFSSGVYGCDPVAALQVVERCSARPATSPPANAAPFTEPAADIL